MTIPWFYRLPRSWRIRRALKGWHYIRGYNGSRRIAAKVFLYALITGKYHRKIIFQVTGLIPN